MDLVFLQILDEGRDIARIGNQDIVAAGRNPHQRIHRQRENVVEG